MLMTSFLKNQLTQIFQQALVAAFPVIATDAIEINPSQIEGVDYQCNSAMKLAKQQGIPPRDFARVWCEYIKANPLIKKIEVAGPGFINIHLDDTQLGHVLMHMLNTPRFGLDDRFKTQKIIVEFSSPNTAKQMHVGHLRSTIIGDCLARTFEFLGADVLRLNHVGDWGTAFGMLIAYLKAEHPAVLAGSEHAQLTELAVWYKLAKKRFDEDEHFKKQSQQEVVALQSGNPESLHAWKIICDISRENYEEIYQLLDVKINERGESFYNPYLAETVADLDKKGMVTLSDGAKCIFLEGFTNRDGELLPMIIQKSDGGYNYSSTDMAAVRHRIDVEQADRIIILTDAGQALHFSMIFKAAEKAKYLTNAKGNHVRLDHVPFGLVLGEDGKKIKTRAGDTEPLINLIYTAIEEAEKVIKARDHGLSADEQKNLARTLGVNAIKYADLVGQRITDYKFSYERMLRFEGNTAAFLMYSYVRIASIKRKVGEKDLSWAAIDVAHPSEHQLGLHLARFDDVLLQLADDLLPHRLCDYLYRLAETFNAFFRDCRVEGVPEESSRLLLCELTAKVLAAGMHLLGLQTVEKM